jgi:hypothetical protein
MKAKRPFWVRVKGFVRLCVGWRRMRWGHCPACNDDAPEVDRCVVCNFFRFLRDEKQPKTLWDFKQAVWMRFKRWVRESDDMADHILLTDVDCHISRSGGTLPENVDKANGKDEAQDEG